MRSEYRRTNITPSVLDRLLDQQPKEQIESQSMRYFDLTQLKRAVARDLEALLNSRCVDLDDDIQRFPQSKKSMVDYGITDLSSLSLLDPMDRAYLRDKIRITIERHEPRLSSIRVQLDAPTETERVLKFRVDALLKAYPTRPPVSFDAMLQPSSNSCQVREN